MSSVNNDIETHYRSSCRKKIQEFEQFSNEVKYYPNVIAIFCDTSGKEIYKDIHENYDNNRIFVVDSIEDMIGLIKAILSESIKKWFFDQSFYNNLSNFYMFVDQEIILCTKENILKKVRKYFDLNLEFQKRRHSSKRRIDILENRPLITSIKIKLIGFALCDLPIIDGRTKIKTSIAALITFIDSMS
ncbi:45043_t:CDS:2 [Gigaspora margarita]|uniref:45043_t:CDS:1 n=1 Tax=Gigaspora margarita TaxID=4874 RepID=A0ABN7V5C2_GIGMA|nr:45043_t:CDS:2 [Gigaspora margarita]